MMNSAKLKKMISIREGGMKAFSAQIGLANTTLHDSLASDERLARMPISNFQKVANGLGMTIDELARTLEED